MRRDRNFAQGRSTARAFSASRRLGAIALLVAPLLAAPAGAATTATCGGIRGLHALTAPGAVVDAGVVGPCLLCRVKDADKAVDGDPSTYASLYMTAFADGDAYLSVTDTATRHPAGTALGFGISEKSAFLAYSHLNSAVITTYLNGVEQESVPFAGTKRTFTLNPAATGGPRGIYFLGFNAGTEFDQIRIRFSSQTSYNTPMLVAEACVGGN